jgi:hypothetical protein
MRQIDGKRLAVGSNGTDRRPFDRLSGAGMETRAAGRSPPPTPLSLETIAVSPWPRSPSLIGGSERNLESLSALVRSPACAGLLLHN